MVSTERKYRVINKETYGDKKRKENLLSATATDKASSTDEIELLGNALIKAIENQDQPRIDKLKAAIAKLKQK